MHTSKYFVLGLALAGITACFFPWAHTLHFGDSNSIGGLCFAEGGFIVAGFALIAILSFAKHADNSTLNSFYKTVLVMAMLLGALALYKVFDLTEPGGKILSAADERIVRYHPAWGLYVAMIAAFGIAALAASQLIISSKKLVALKKWTEAAEPRRFYIPAHHTTSL